MRSGFAAQISMIRAAALNLIGLADRDSPPALRQTVEVPEALEKNEAAPEFSCP